MAKEFMAAIGRDSLDGSETNNRKSRIFQDDSSSTYFANINLLEVISRKYGLSNFFNTHLLIFFMQFICTSRRDESQHRSVSFEFMR